MEAPNMMRLLLLTIFILSVSWSNPVSLVSENFFNCLHRYSQFDSSIPIVFPNTSSYSILLQSTFQNPRFNSSTTTKPLFIISPFQDSHVQTSVLCCKENGIHLRVRSGGHDYEGLSSVSHHNPFAMIDLSNFTSIQVDIEDNSASIQAGATIGEVYYRIAEKSDIHGFPAAWWPTVGVGGMFSGGGIGNLMRKYGLAADNIVDARLVDSNGNSYDGVSMGKELFWAIRGGGAASFGVVISWKIRLVQVPKIVTIFTIQKTIEENASELVRKWQEVAPVLDKNLFIRVILQGVGSGVNRTVQASFDALFLGEPKELLKIIGQKFPELGVKMRDCVQMSWIESVLFFAGYPSGTSKEVLIKRTAPSPRAPFKGKSDFVRKPFPLHGLDGLWSLLKEEVKALLVMEPFGGRMSEISESEIPFPHRKGNLHILQYLVVVEDDKDIDFMKRLYNYMTAFVSKSPRAAYLNFRDLDLGKTNKWNARYRDAKSWGLKYFEGNFRRLALVKGVADKENFFRNEQSIPPLLQV